MDCGLIFMKTSTCKSNPDIEYLDETSEYKMKIKSQRDGVSLEQLRMRMC
jgi:hypothetical protein